MPWDKITGLWADWKPTLEESIFWRGELRNYDPDLARRAVARLRKEASGFSKPVWRDLEKIIRDLNQERREPSKTEFFHIAFICQESGTRKPKKEAGYFEQFSWVAHWDSGVEAYQVPTQAHISARCRRYEDEFGGRWVHMLTKHYPDIPRKAREFGNGMVVLPQQSQVRQPDQPDKYTPAGFRKGTPKTRAITQDTAQRQMLALQATVLEEELAAREGREARTTEELIPEYQKPKPAKLPAGVTTLGAAVKKQTNDFNPNRLMPVVDDSIPF